MKLLIVTQSVDMNDPVLGFFHRWIEEFAKHAEQVIVIALGAGEYHLPDNVRVFSLGKEQLRKRIDLGNSARPSEPWRRRGLRSVIGEQLRRLEYIFNFYCLIWRERKDYDSVFVHMNPEYVILGGMFWRLWGKQIALWYTHKSVDLKLYSASFFVHDILTASKESFRLKNKKVHIVGHGIDIDFFTPDVGVARDDHMLSVGRLMPSKRHDLTIRAAAFAGRALRIAGDGPEQESLEQLARSLGADARFLGGLTQAQLRDEYRCAGILVHTSETGSLDKVVLEALACGLPVITTSDVLSGLPVTHVAPIPEEIARAIATMRKVDPLQLASHVRKNHGLETLISRIMGLLA